MAEIGFRVEKSLHVIPEAGALLWEIADNPQRFTSYDVGLDLMGRKLVHDAP
jgi:hypothetical protein